MIIEMHSEILFSIDCRRSHTSDNVQSVVSLRPMTNRAGFTNDLCRLKPRASRSKQDATESDERVGVPGKFSLEGRYDVFQ